MSIARAMPQEWMSKLTGNAVDRSNRIKDIDGKVAVSLQNKGVIRIIDGRLYWAWICVRECFSLYSVVYVLHFRPSVRRGLPYGSAKVVACASELCRHACGAYISNNHERGDRGNDDGFISCSSPSVWF